MSSDQVDISQPPTAKAKAQDAVVELRNAFRIYNPGHYEVRAMNDVSLVVHPGDFLALVGPSGSGKSTILNTMGCLDKPTSGRVFINGVDVTDQSAAERGKVRREKIGFIFQSFNLIPVMSAYENIAFSLEIQGASAREIDAAVTPLLERLGISGERNRRPNQLSGGQQQRVAIGRALVKKPAIVLADEPTANLDRKTSTEIINLMRQMNVEFGATFVFSTHDEHLINNVRRIVRLEDGRVIDDQLVAKP